MSFLRHQEADVVIVEKQIRSFGLVPKRCPLCRQPTKYPRSREAMNALSRYRKRYICCLCGEAEYLGNWWSKCFPRKLVAKIGVPK